MQSRQADPHDIFAIESILAARTDRAPPLAHDPHGQPAEPHLNIAPEISVGAPIPRVEPDFRSDDVKASADTKTSADTKPSANQIATIPADDIKVDKPADQPPSRWARRVVMALLGLAGAVGAAGWQHYGDHATYRMKTMAANWTPAFVTAALMPAEKSAAAEQPAAPVQAQADAVPAPVEQPVTAAAAPAPEATQLQAMASDLAAMGRQVEELKSTVAQLRTSQAQLTRDLARAQEARAEIRAPEPARPKVANAAPTLASAPSPRPAASTAAASPPPVRKPKPVAPAQAAYVPPPPPVQLQSAPPQALADDGAPLVRPPMPLR